MANEKECGKKGIKPYDVDSWDKFSETFDGEFCTKEDEASNGKIYLGDYVWRGQRCKKKDEKGEGLISSFDREFRQDDGDFVYDPDRDTILKRHLNSFAYAVRSRLKEFGLTVREIKAAIREKLLSKNHIWALAQHYGLKTPLLDWSYSPYVAAYFAFQEKPDDGEKSKKEDNQKYRIVWGLNYKQVCDNYKEAGVFNTGIEYFDPMSSEHPRLINQRGLFTIAKKGEAIEKIVGRNAHVDCNGPWLIKIKIKDSKDNRENFLRRLNAMNINHMSLLPEIKGATEFCNIGLEFDEYARFHGQWW